MPFFIENDLVSDDVPVGVITQTVMAPTDLAQSDSMLIVLENLSLTETFEGVTASSPNGSTQWVAELNDEFASIGPGVTRRMLLPADRRFVRITGKFVAAPDTMRISTVLFRTAIRRG